MTLDAAIIDLKNQAKVAKILNYLAFYMIFYKYLYGRGFGDLGLPHQNWKY
jgi:hypothetical protein